MNDVAVTHLDATAEQLLAFVGRHQKIALMFSAGRDSAACLKLLRAFIQRVYVIWADPGNPYPETIEYMKRIAGTVPHFFIARGNQPHFVKSVGRGADIVPFEAAALGHTITMSEGPRLVHTSDCCGANMWAPMNRTITDSGASGVIQGVKECDEWRGPMHSVIRGCEYHYPIFKWTTEEVMEFLGDDVPPSYQRGLKSSLDCMDCVGYLRHNPGRMRDLESRYPETYSEIRPVLRWMKHQAMRNLNDLMEATT